MDSSGNESEKLDNGIDILQNTSKEGRYRRKISFDDFQMDSEVVFCREGVLVQAQKEDRLFSGCLRISETEHGAFITWDRDQAIQQSLSHRAQGKPKMVLTDYGNVKEDVGGPPSFSVGSLPSSEWAVIAGEGGGGVGDTTPIQRVRFQSLPKDEGRESSGVVTFSSQLEEKQLKIVIEVGEMKSFKLSDDSNQVVIMMKDGTVHNNIIFLDEGPDEFLAALEKYASIKKSISDDNLFLLTDKRIAALDQSLSELNLLDIPKNNSEYVWRTISDFQKDPYTTGLSIFSRITDKILFSPVDKEYRSEEDMAELLQGESIMSGLLDCSQAEQSELESGESGTPWQLVTNNQSSCVMSSLPPVARTTPLCQLDWELHMDAEGVVAEVPQLIDKIFRGGLEDGIRPEVWQYLLGAHQWHQPAEVRDTNRKARVEEYFRMKLQWKSMSEDQQNRFSAFRERKTQIEKDIGRTDRNQPFYQGDENPNVLLLSDILMTYVMYNFDLGYVQGMSDLLSPILFVMKNEVDAFWCFVGFMDKVWHNFEFDQGGMKRQLEDLSHILKFVDPVFFNYLEAKESGNLYFCFRWLLIWFKREFTYEDTMTLWEVFWTKKPCKNFHLLFCVALLDTEKSSILENNYGFTEILKHVNDMSHRIELTPTLCKAEAVFLALSTHPETPEKVINILGLAPPGAEQQISNGINGENSKVCSEPLPITSSSKTLGTGRARSCTESSNASSLNHSSSVEVLSEMDEEQKFDNSINSGFF